jgi:hypothetical protein
VQVFNPACIRQGFVSAFEIDVITPDKISLGVADQPVPRLYMQQSVLRADLSGLFHLDRIHNERLNSSIQHIAPLLGAYLLPTSI